MSPFRTHSTLSGNVVAALRSVVGSGSAALQEPSFSGNELMYLKECVDSTFVSSIGKFVDRFEDELAAFVGAKHAVAIVNGTSALHIAMKLAGVKSGDEVLVPALNFVAAANAVTYCGATPHFVDSDVHTLGVDSLKLREYLASHTESHGGSCISKLSGRVIRALVPMHTFGHPFDVEGMLAVAHDYNLALVEDAAESMGSYYHGQHTGTFGLMGALSFNGNKTITTGGGGAIVTNSTELAQRAKHLTTTAKLPHAWEFRHDEIGYNYRMPNLNAALGCAQLEQLPKKLAAKRGLYKKYSAAFELVGGLKLVAEPVDCKSNYWLQTLILDSENMDQRDAILKATNDEMLMTRPAWTLMHELEPFRGCPRMDLRVAQSLSSRIINIPSSPTLMTKTA